VVVLVIGLLVSLRVVASATRGKDGRAAAERTSQPRGAEKNRTTTGKRRCGAVTGRGATVSGEAGGAA
jgi:hypothetical protein